MMKKTDEKEAEHKKTIHHVPKQKPINVWMAISVVLAIVLALGFFTGGCDITGFIISDSMSSNDASNKVINFLNTELLQGVEAEFKSVNETSGMYLVSFTVEGVEYSAFVSKDGKFFFPQVIDLQMAEDAAQDVAQDAQPTTSFDAPDAEVPVVKFFVMSFCPYGQQAENGLGPVYELFKDAVTFEPHFVIYSDYASRFGANWSEYCLDEEEKYCSMHGATELNEDIRQMCVYNNYDSDIWWNYVNEVNAKCSYQDIETCWKDAAATTGVDVTTIETCFDENAETIAAAELALNEQYDVRGSPTIFVNEQLYNQARSPEAFKNAICTGFTDAPESCSQELSATSSANGNC